MPGHELHWMLTEGMGESGATLPFICGAEGQDGRVVDPGLG